MVSFSSAWNLCVTEIPLFLRVVEKSFSIRFECSSPSNFNYMSVVDYPFFTKYIYRFSRYSKLISYLRNEGKLKIEIKTCVQVSSKQSPVEVEKIPSKLQIRMRNTRTLTRLSFLVTSEVSDVSDWSKEALNFLTYSIQLIIIYAGNC